MQLSVYSSWTHQMEYGGVSPAYGVPEPLTGRVVHQGGHQAPPLGAPNQNHHIQHQTP